MSLAQSIDALKVVLMDGGELGNATMYLLKHFRKQFDRKAPDPMGNVELQFHTYCRSMIFHPNRINFICSMPGMVDYLLSSEQEDLLMKTARFTQEHFGGYCKTIGSPADHYIDAYITNAKERKRVQKASLDYFNLSMAESVSAPSSMQVSKQIVRTDYLRYLPKT